MVCVHLVTVVPMLVQVNGWCLCDWLWYPLLSEQDPERALRFGRWPSTSPWRHPRPVLWLAPGAPLSCLAVGSALYSQGLSAALTGWSPRQPLDFPVRAHVTRYLRGVSVSNVKLSTPNKLYPHELQSPSASYPLSCRHYESTSYF